MYLGNNGALHNKFWKNSKNSLETGLGKWLRDRKDYWPWGVRWAWETVRQPSRMWDFLLEAQIPSMGGATILYLCCVLLWPASVLRHIIGHCGEEFGDWRFWLQKVQRTFEKEGWGGDWTWLKLTCRFADEDWRLWRPNEENWSIANWRCNVPECYDFGCLQSAESWYFCFVVFMKVRRSVRLRFWKLFATLLLLVLVWKFSMGLRGKNDSYFLWRLSR